MTEEEEMEAHMDAMDDAMFGDSNHDTYPQGNVMSWDDHFLNGRESGAGPDVENSTIDELLNQGYTRHEVADSMRKLADRIENNGSN